MGHPRCCGQDAHHFLAGADPASQSFFCFCCCRDFQLFKGDQETPHSSIVFLFDYGIFLLDIVYRDTAVAATTYMYVVIY